ncbi:hypothetical protein ACETU7_02920 [Rhodococcus sp. 3Y1]
MSGVSSVGVGSGDSGPLRCWSGSAYARTPTSTAAIGARIHQPMRVLRRPGVDRQGDAQNQIVASVALEIEVTARNKGALSLERAATTHAQTTATSEIASAMKKRSSWC